MHTAKRLLWKPGTNSRFIYSENRRDPTLRETHAELHTSLRANPLAEKQQGVRVGNLIVLAKRDAQHLALFKRRLLAQSYQVDETAHFIVCHKLSMNKIILVHRFRQEEVDADLITLLAQELPQTGLLASPKDYGAVLFAVVASTFPAPRNQAVIWRHFCLNTLARLRNLMAQPPEPLPVSPSHVEAFAAIYRRVQELVVGESMLDVGSSFGFLPLLLAEWNLSLSLVGCDLNPDAIQCSTDLATVLQRNQVVFFQRDVLAEDFVTLGQFETVTVLHLLEHLTEEEVQMALSHLLQVTTQRLVIAVPYEEETQSLYGHQQTFTPVKLDAWGRWCVEKMGGTARYWCEEVMGGLLVVDHVAT